MCNEAIEKIKVFLMLEIKNHYVGEFLDTVVVYSGWNLKIGDNNKSHHTTTIISRTVEHLASLLMWIKVDPQGVTKNIHKCSFLISKKYFPRKKLLKSYNYQKNFFCALECTMTLKWAMSAKYYIE